MKFNIKHKRLSFKCLLASGLLVASLNGIGQGRSAVIADPSLGKLELTNFAGQVLDANNLQSDQLIKLKVPVGSISHGKALPAGSCIIKIGLGSKLLLDPGFDLTNAGGNSYFNWTSSVNGGQLQLSGELVNTLPATVSSIDLSFRLKVKEEGNSAITANFLITNHNSTVVLSDENGANNSSVISYQISKGSPIDPSLLDGKLKLNVFPNPAKDVTAVTISVLQGKFVGKYKISLFDLAGKLIQAKDMQLNLVNTFTYNFGTIAAGKYLIKVANADGTETSLLKFQKL